MEVVDEGEESDIDHANSDTEKSELAFYRLNPQEIPVTGFKQDMEVWEYLFKNTEVFGAHHDWKSGAYEVSLHLNFEINKDHKNLLKHIFIGMCQY